MQTVLDVLKKTTDWFSSKGLENARGDAEQLLAHGLGCKRLDLYLRFDQPLEASDLDQLRPLMKRRASREPLQHIIGEWPFCDLMLKVDCRALIPRPETEELVDWLVNLGESPKRILDLGTGTGAIALSLALAFPSAEVVAVDLSEDALSLAKENAAQNDLSNVCFAQGSWFEPVEGAFDWIISNPPYLTDEEWQEAEPEVRQYDPFSALVAPSDGFADLEHIVREAYPRLNVGGRIALETGIAQHAALLKLADSLGYHTAESMQDLSGRDRFITAQK